MTSALTRPEMIKCAEMIQCARCRRPMGYVHGHAACLDGTCQMFAVNQDECCSGDTAATCPAPSANVAAR